MFSPHWASTEVSLDPWLEEELELGSPLPDLLTLQPYLALGMSLENLALEPALRPSAHRLMLAWWDNPPLPS